MVERGEEMGMMEGRERGSVVEEGKGERKVWNVGNENGRKK